MKQYQYCIEVKRESRDDDYILHETFTKQMSEDEIIQFLNDNEHPYLPHYEKLTFIK